MTLEELKAAMDAAVAEAAKNPDDQGLKAKAEAATKAYNDAKAKAEAGDDDTDESGWDEKTKAYIAKLRGENAKHRQKAKELGSKLTETEAQKKAILKAAGIEDESDNPEEKLKVAQAQTNTLNFRNAILETALEHGIPKSELDYFSYLVERKTGELKDGEELSEDALGAIVTEVKKRIGGGSKGNTSVGGKTGGAAPAGGDGDVTLDQFARMTISEKSGLYNKNPDLYTRLVNEAKAAGRLI